MKNMMKRFGISLLLALLIVVGLRTNSNAQGGLNADGRDFYIGLLYPSFNSQSLSRPQVLGFYGVYALISSYANNKVTVSYFDDNGKEVNKTSYNVGKRQAIQVPLDVSHMRMTEPGEIPEYKSCHITGQSSINVQYFSTGSCSGGSYLAIPTNVLGKQYVVESYNDNVGGNGGALSHENSAGYFMVIAAFGNTQVTITPSSSTAGKHVGVYCGLGAGGGPQPFTIGLSQGQCYMVKSEASDANCDISGTTIISNQPVAVIAGHENALTNGSDPDPAGSQPLEARDYMVEQMLPVEYWDTTGYFSIPFLDSKKPARDGEGDEYRVFTGIIPNSSQPVGPGIPTASNIDLNCGYRTYTGVGPYQVPAPSLTNLTNPVNYKSTNGTKFGVVQYDQRMQGAGAPFPAPNQMTIIPRSRWKNSFLWYVPANTFEILQGYYINLLCYRTDYDKQRIKIALNNGKPAPINGYGLKLKYTQMPCDDSLAGYVISIGPGAYYATVDSNGHPFMIYNYGFRAIDPDRDLGDFCGDDHFFSYALPVGFTAKGDSAQLTITVDTLCAKWHICVHDGRPVNFGIKSLQILNDPDGDYIRPPQISRNVQFDPSVDPNGTNEIDLSGNDSTYCTDVLVKNPLDTAGAYGAIYILDNQGNDYLVKLNYRAPKLGTFVVPKTLQNQADSIIYPATEPGGSYCATVYYYNKGKSGDNAIDLTSADLKVNDGNFKITNITPPMPITLQVGDTVKVTVCFTPQDKNVSIDSLPLHLDSLILTTPCFKAPITLVGPVGIPLIYATDRDFGDVVIGSSKCDTVTITNIGNVTYTVTDSVIDACLHGNKHDFSWNAGSNLNKNRLPVILQPGQFIRVSFCFTPSVNGFDSTAEHWITDVTGPFKDSLKGWSALTGNGIRPGVIWDRKVQGESTVCDSPVTVKCFLKNTNTATTYVDSVFFKGLDADEYTLVSNDIILNPISPFAIKAGDSIYVIYRFQPNNSIKGFRQRSAALVALFKSADLSGPAEDSTIINISDTILYPALSVNPDTLDYGFVSINLPSTRTFLLSDTGTAPYVLDGVLFAAPVDSIINSTTGAHLQIGDTLFPGQQVLISVSITRTNYGDTIVPMTLLPSLACGNTVQVYMHSNVTNTALLATGWPAPDTYINCREHKSVIRVQNLGTDSWNLVSITLEADGTTTGLSEFDLIDSNKIYRQQIVFNKALFGNSSLTNSMNIGVVFHPTHSGPDSVRVHVLWDSAGVKKDSLFTILSGTGISEKTTVSAENNDPNSPVSGWYVYTTGDNLQVPLRFDVTALPTSASAKRVTFDVKWKRDVFQLASNPNAFNWGNNYNGVITLPPTVSPDGMYESVSVDATNSGIITGLDEVGRLNLTAMVNRDTTTQILISNIHFYDDAGVDICYIEADSIPGNFISKDVCGNTEIRDYLTNNTVTTRIISLTPNPASASSSPELTYDVHVAGVPVKVEIFNMLGEVVRVAQGSAATTVGRHSLKLNTEGLESGTYNVRLSTPKSTQSAQFVLRK